MRYSECLEYLSRLGNEILTMKFGLETIRALLRGMGKPQDDFASVLVAGTNGKGSVTRFLGSISQEAGVRTGLFTSPHLVRVTERVKIDGEEVSPETFAKEFSRVVAYVNLLDLPCHPTFFEMVTATALSCFSRRGVQLAILEVGMGGRLDSTNVVEPLCSLITPISCDHQSYLGDTLVEIASEKAGIMRRNRPTISSPQVDEVINALQISAKRTGADLRFTQADLEINHSDDGRYSFSEGNFEFRLGVPGRFQVGNARLALEAARELTRVSFVFSPEDLCRGIERTRIEGVLQVWDDNLPVIADGAHNPAAAKELAEFVNEFTRSPRNLIFGAMKDKDISRVLGCLEPCFETVYLTSIDSPRAATAWELKTYCPSGTAVENPVEAYHRAMESRNTTVIAGSLYLIGELMSRLRGEIGDGG